MATDAKEAWDDYCQKNQLQTEERGKGVWIGVIGKTVYPEPMFGRNKNGSPIDPGDFGAGI